MNWRGDQSAEDVLRVGLTTLFRDSLIKDAVSQQTSWRSAEQFADRYLQSVHGKEHLKLHLHLRSKELLNETVLAAIYKIGGFWRSVSVNLISGAIGAVLGPFFWGLTVLIFALGQNNAALPENKAKEWLDRFATQPISRINSTPRP